MNRETMEDLNALVGLDLGVEVRIREEYRDGCVKYRLSAISLFVGEKGKLIASVSDEVFWKALRELRSRVEAHPRPKAMAAKARMGIK